MRRPCGRPQPARLPADGMALSLTGQDHPTLRLIDVQQANVRHARPVAATRGQGAGDAEGEIAADRGLRPVDQPPPFAGRLADLKLARRLTW